MRPVIVSTAIGLLALVVGLVIGWPVLVALSIVFTIVQLAMVVAKTARLTATVQALSLIHI